MNTIIKKLQDMSQDMKVEKFVRLLLLSQATNATKATKCGHLFCFEACKKILTARPNVDSRSQEYSG